MTSFVPIMLGAYWNDGAQSSVTTFRLGLANGGASLLVALLAPVIGAIGDRAGRRKRGLLTFAAVGVVMTGALYFVEQGQWPVAVACYVFATIGFAVSNTLYDSLLVDIVSPRFYDRVSAYGFALGYLGGALLFAVNVWMVAAPQSFGLDSPTVAIRVAFLMVAVWWAVFSLPLLLWVPEHRAADAVTRGAITAGLRELLATLHAVRRHRSLWIFLLAYWLYIDGVYTIIKMAVDFGMSQGLDMQDLISAILLTNFIGFPAAMLFGYIGDWFGTRRGIYLALVVYIAVTVSAVFVTTEAQFYALAAAIGLVQGGVQSLSRSLYARLIPAGRTGEYFGFYNMLGKFAAVLGPVLTGSVALITGSQRAGILSILLLFMIGLWLLSRVHLAATGEAGTGAPYG
ncbi:MAG TPA: MFS transporter [Chromatiales bacterium]|nr:MFS transporter [Chromatiales bacterium]